MLVLPSPTLQHVDSIHLFLIRWYRVSISLSMYWGECVEIMCEELAMPGTGITPLSLCNERNPCQGYGVEVISLSVSATMLVDEWTFFYPQGKLWIAKDREHRQSFCSSGPWTWFHRFISFHSIHYCCSQLLHRSSFSRSRVCSMNVAQCFSDHPVAFPTSDHTEAG